MHFPSCNTVFSTQVRHLGLLGPQLSQDWSQAKGEENPSEKINTEQSKLRKSVLSTSTVGINIVITFLAAQLRSVSLIQTFLYSQWKENSISIHWTKHNKYSEATYQCVQFNMGFKVKTALAVGFPDLTNKIPDAQLNLNVQINKE